MVSVKKVHVADINLHGISMITEKLLQICEHVGNSLRGQGNKVHTLVTPREGDLWHLNRYRVKESAHC